MGLENAQAVNAIRHFWLEKILREQELPSFTRTIAAVQLPYNFQICYKIGIANDLNRLQFEGPGQDGFWWLRITRPKPL